MYLVEIKIGDAKIRRYVSSPQILGKLIEENIDTYEYVKILKEVPNNELIENETKHLHKK
jgi:hypothetical protein